MRSPTARCTCITAGRRRPALQTSIALAAIALLTRRTWLNWGVFGVGAIGVTLGGAAPLHI